MNEIIKAMEERRSIRKFKADMPSKADIEQILEAGTYAASGMGKQGVITIAVTNKEIRDKLAVDNCRIGGWKEGFDPFYGAPVVVIVLAKKDVFTHVYDGSLVMGNLMLAAHSLGLGRIWASRENGKESATARSAMSTAISLRLRPVRQTVFSSSNKTPAGKCKERRELSKEFHSDKTGAEKANRSVRRQACARPIWFL